MTDEVSSAATAEINLPLETFNEGASTNDEPPPPLYESIENKWSNRTWNMIRIFYFLCIHATLITFLIIPSYSFLESYTKRNNDHQHVTKSSTESVMYALVSAATASGIISFVACLLLLMCASRIMMCTLIMAVLIEAVLGVAVLFVTVPWFIAILPFCSLFITLISALVVRKSILYDDTHVRVACAVFRRRPLLILMVFCIFVAKILWFVSSSLMMLGSVFLLYLFATNDPKASSPRETELLYTGIFMLIIITVYLSLWVWGAVIMTNIVRFITASYVGRWCLGDHVAQQRTNRNSIKQAFTTYLGTACFGSAPKRIIEAVLSLEESEAGMGRFCRINPYGVRMKERMLGCVTGQSLVYEALTRQPYSQATRIAVKLVDGCRKIVLIDTAIYFYIIKLTVVLISSVISGLLAHKFLNNSPAQDITATVVGAGMIGALISYFLTSSMTTMMKSCATAIFTCFLIYPAELSATHLEHFQSLAAFWENYYPTELVIENGFYRLLESMTNDNL